MTISEKTTSTNFFSLRLVTVFLTASALVTVLQLVLLAVIYSDQASQPRPSIDSLVATASSSQAGSYAAIRSNRELNVVAENSAPLQLFYPFFPKDEDEEGLNGVLYLQNVAGNALHYAINAYNAGGQGQNIGSGVIAVGATQNVSATELHNLSVGSYWLYVASTGQAESVVRVEASNASETTAASFALYPGIREEQTRALDFAPFYGGASASQLMLINHSPFGAATVTVSFQSTTGTIVAQLTLPIPRGGYQRVLAPATLPADFIGLAHVTSTQSVAGVLIQHQVEDGLEIQPALPPAARQHLLPRLFKNVDEGGGARSTRLWLANSGDLSAPYTLTYSGLNAGSVPPLSGTLAADQVMLIDLNNQSSLVAGVYAATLRSDTPLLVAELTDYAATTSYSSAAYGAQQKFVAQASISAQSQLALPRLTSSDTHYSLMNLYNPNTAETMFVVQYFRPDGTVAGAHSGMIPANQVSRIDLRQAQNLPAGFEGSAMISSTQPLAAWVDEYAMIAALPFALAALELAPTGPVLVGQPYTATVMVTSVTVTLPLTYTWQATDLPQMQQQAGVTDTRQLLWTTPGSKVITVTATNSINQSASITQLIAVATTSVNLSPTLTATLSYTDRHGVTTLVQIPTGAVTQTTQIAYIPLPTSTQSLSANLAFIGRAFELLAYQGGALQTNFLFAQPITLQVEYTDEEVTAVDEASLQLLVHEKGAWLDAATTCVPASSYKRDPAANRLAVSICHLSQYAIVGASLQWLYLPVVTR